MTIPRPPELLFRRHSQVIDAAGCHPWQGPTTPKGYGVVCHRRKKTLAHRFCYEMHHGPVPEGLFVDHRCMNKACVNIDHLRLLTHQDNSRHKGTAANNTSGYRGVTYVKARNRYRARVIFNGRTYGAGHHFTTPEAAGEAARLKRIELYGAHLEPTPQGDI